MYEALESRVLFASAVPIVSLFSTGIATNNANGTPATRVAEGKADPHYSIISQPTTSQVTQAQVTLEDGGPLPTAWLANDLSSEWISPHASENVPGQEAVGTFKFVTHFSLAGLNPATAKISMSILVDNAATVFLNGTKVATVPQSDNSFSTFSNFTIGSNFVAGTNTLEFDALNTTSSASVNPLGLRVKMSGTAIPTAATGSIAGKVFHDLSGNGSQDGGEPNLSGWTVFLDTNKNGKLDAGEKSTTSSSTGAYTFANLTPASYRVAEVLKSGWVRVAPSAGYFDVTVTAGSALTGKAFADARAVTISGSVFNDSNADGFRDTTETGLSAWKVFVDSNNNGKLDAGELTTTTSSAGAFSFTGLKPGTYVIRLVAQTGWTATLPLSETIILRSGWTVGTITFGMKRS